MTMLIHHLITQQAQDRPQHAATTHKGISLSYAELDSAIQKIAIGFAANDIKHGDRIAIYLPKCEQAVISYFAATTLGAVFVPINPLLKAEQVAYILKDCNVKLCVTSHSRWQNLVNELANCPDLKTIVTIDETSNTNQTPAPPNLTITNWLSLGDASTQQTTEASKTKETDLAAILYTSGSTGLPKGVMLSHKNLVVGAQSVAQYLHNTAEDRILCVLPFSFDYGLSQLTTAFSAGASVVLMEYLFPKDIIKLIVKERITGLAGVPPIWIPLAKQQWPIEAKQSLRYITNSGGAMPSTTLEALTTQLLDSDIFLMYGLTEAFRSTYLEPKQVKHRPNSIGKAIPNSNITVLNKQGKPCAANEPGELIHSGPLVAMGYWNNEEKTQHHFKPIPGSNDIAAWSGDTVRMDEEGYLYFMGREDEMIKTSGYRVSPSEIEDILYTMPDIKEAVALGLAHEELGQAILLLVTSHEEHKLEDIHKDTHKDFHKNNGNLQNQIAQHCQQHLANYMQPKHIEIINSMPKTPNGKIDRKALHQQYEHCFETKSIETKNIESKSSKHKKTEPKT